MAVMSSLSCSSGPSVVPTLPHKMPLNGDPEKLIYGSIWEARSSPTKSGRTGMVTSVQSGQSPILKLSPLVRMSISPSLPGRSMLKR